jgi:large subunit ribosomal protein L30
MAKKSKKIRITLTSSPIGHKPNQRKTAKALGLTKISKTVEKEATPAILGMVNTISHLVQVEEI